MTTSTMFDAFRTVLAGLSLTTDIYGVPLEAEAQPRFETECALDLVESGPGVRISFNQNINYRMTATRGVIVKGTRDTANKAWAAAVEAIIAAFLRPSYFETYFRPTGCRKVIYRGARKEEKTAEVWLAIVDFEVEIALAISA